MTNTVTIIVDTAGQYLQYQGCVENLEIIRSIDPNDDGVISFYIDLNHCKVAGDEHFYKKVEK